MLPRDFPPLSDAARSGLRHAGAQAAILAGMALILVDDNDDVFQPWRNVAGCCLILAGWVLHPNPGWQPHPRPGGPRSAPAPAGAPASLAGALWQSATERLDGNLRDALQIFLGMGHSLSFCFASSSRYAPALGAWGMFGGFGILPRSMHQVTLDISRSGVPDFSSLSEFLRYQGARLGAVMLQSSVASLQSGLTGMYFLTLDPDERFSLKVDLQRALMHHFGIVFAWSHFVLHSCVILFRYTSRNYAPIGRGLDMSTRLPGLALCTWALSYPLGRWYGRAPMPASFGPQHAAMTILDLLADDGHDMAHFPSPRAGVPAPLSAANGRAPAPPPIPEAPYAGGPRLDHKHDRKSFARVRRGLRTHFVAPPAPGPLPGPAPLSASSSLPVRGPRPIAVAAVMVARTPGNLSPYALPGGTIGNAPGGPPLWRDDKSS